MRSLVVLTLLILLAGCSSGPSGPEKGTPAFYWQAARETFSAGDYMKTLDHLGQLEKTPNEFTDRAFAWHLVLLGGLQSGNAEVAESFETGSRANTTNPAPFRRQMNDSRTRANQLALSLGENMNKFLAGSNSGNVTLAFPFPEGITTPVATLSKISSGVLPPETEIADAQNKTLSRAVLLATCRAAGAGTDVPKARELFKSGSVDVPRATFLLAMAEQLHNQAQLYAKLKLAQPDRLKFFCEQALASLKSVPESAETKGLTKKIQATMKM
jgi:hypothetical protein